MQAIIEFDKTSKSFGDFQAVKNLSLNIYPGELFSLLGLNGAGKTSTIRMLTGLSKPTEGTVTVASHDVVNEGNKAKSLIGYIPDRGYLFEKLTVYETLYLCGRLHSLDTKTLKERIDMVLEKFHLADWNNELVENLSHGMRQRLVFCAALLHDPKILVIDEPMVGLDPFGARSLKKSLKEFTDDGGTVFLSTHTLSVASELSDRLGIIHEGELIACGSINEISESANLSGDNLEEVFLTITSQTI